MSKNYNQLEVVKHLLAPLPVAMAG